MSVLEPSAAAAAFDAAAPGFDQRFGAWLSVAAQRRAVRAELLAAFPVGARVLEIGGGTGEDALWLARHGRRVLLTDPAPAMIAAAAAKLAGVEGTDARLASAERLDALSGGPFDGAFSNFAALNCVTDLAAFGRGLAGKLRPGAPVLLVLFGTACPGEMLVEALRGRPRAMVRRWSRGPVEARLGGRPFAIRYHRRKRIEAALAPWFRLERRRAIGLFVPPSAAEPWISRHPRLLAALEALDRRLASPLAPLGDHVLYAFRRTDAP